jgi:hypothetical protein
MLAHGLFFLLLSPLFPGLLLVQNVQGLYRVFELGVANVRVDFGGGDAFVTEGALSESQVTGVLVDSGGERMAKRVDGIAAGDPGSFKPIGEAKLYLSGSDPFPPVGEKERFIGFRIVVAEVSFEQLLETCAEEHDLSGAVLPVGLELLLCDVHIFGIECHERSKPDACAQEERKNEVVPFRDWTSADFKGFEQRANLAICKDGRRLSRASSKTDKRCWVVFHIFRISKELEEGAESRLRTIQGGDRFWTAAFSMSEGFRSQVAGDKAGCDLMDFDSFAYPLFNRTKIPKVDGSGERAFPVGPELGVESAYGGCKLHRDYCSNESFAWERSQRHSAKFCNPWPVRAIFAGSRGELASETATNGRCGQI